MCLNRAPAQCRVWPVIAPAAAFVRAGAVLRGAGVLLRRFALGLRPALRFCCSVFPRHMPGSAFLSARFAFVHACCLSCAKQDGLRCLAFLFRRVEIAICVFSRCYGGREAGQRDVGAFHAARFAFSVRPCDSVGAFCPRFTPGIAFLL